jgi:hypothetical protein
MGGKQILWERILYIFSPPTVQVYPAEGYYSLIILSFPLWLEGAHGLQKPLLSRRASLQRLITPGHLRLHQRNRKSDRPLGYQGQLVRFLFGKPNWPPLITTQGHTDSARVKSGDGGGVGGGGGLGDHPSPPSGNLCCRR